LLHEHERPRVVLVVVIGGGVARPVVGGRRGPGRDIGGGGRVVRGVVLVVVFLAVFVELEGDNVLGEADRGVAGLAGTHGVKGTEARHECGEERTPGDGRHCHVGCVKGVGARGGQAQALS